MIELFDAPKHSDLIYDVGMHKGEDSKFYLEKGFRVVGIEADPILAKHCRDLFKDYIAAGRLTVIEGAIVDPLSAAGVQKVTFFRNDMLSVWGTIDVNWVQRNVKKGTSSSPIEVNVIDFASILIQHGIPHYMKIDIEGLDMTCVRTLRQFRQRPNYISIESDKNNYSSIQLEIDTLVELGYDGFQAIEQSAIPYSQTPPRPAREGIYKEHYFEKGSSGLFGKELGGEYISRRSILCKYRLIRLGYYLVGDDGVVNKQLKFRGAKRLRSFIIRILGSWLNATVPGWYDTHAKHSSIKNLA